MRGKKYQTLHKKLTLNRVYPLSEAIDWLVNNPSAKFDESVDATLCLGVSAGNTEQQVRGFTVLPYGSGRETRVLVFAKGLAEEEAKKAGADMVGGEELVKKIKDGYMDFDRAISTPDMMPVVSKIAKILGPKGLMPNPKMGTVTAKIGPAVEREKKGKAIFRTDKNGIVHCSIGRRSQGLEKIKKNFLTFLQAVIKAKPSSSKGVYLKKITLSLTMGPGVSTDVSDSQAQIV